MRNFSAKSSMLVPPFEQAIMSCSIESKSKQPSKRSISRQLTASTCSTSLIKTVQLMVLEIITAPQNHLINCIWTSNENGCIQKFLINGNPYPFYSWSGMNKYSYFPPFAWPFLKDKQLGIGCFRKSSKEPIWTVSMIFYSIRDEN